MNKFVLLGFIALLCVVSLASANINNVSNYWKFNEQGNSLIANDTTGVRNLTANTTLTSFILGKLNNAINITNNSIGNTSLNSTTGSTNFAFGTGNFTIALWINKTGGFAYQMVELAQATNGWGLELETNGTICWVDSNLCRGNAGISVANGTWNRIIFVREGTGANQFKIYINGVNYANRTLASDYTNSTTPLIVPTTGGVGNLYLDDFRIYKGYAWNVSDISSDWNDGGGRELGLPIQVGLNFPSSNLATFNTTFNATLTSVNTTYNLRNATLFVWNTDGNLLHRQNISMSGSTNDAIITANNLTVGRRVWNVLGCNALANGTSFCTMAINNITFDYGFSINSLTFNATTSSGNLEGFTANLSLDASQQIVSASLWYNGTEYSGASVTSSGTEYIISKAISITTTPGTKNWFYAFNYFGGGQINLTNQNQVVTDVNITTCQTGSMFPYLNFTAYDEQSRGRTIPFSFEATFTLLSADGTPYKNLSISNQTATEVKICISPQNINHIINADIRYGQTPNATYNDRSYYYRNSTIVNVTSNVNLFLLNQSSATSFILSVIDQNQQPVEDALIYSLRYYEGNNSYQIVQVGLTDSSGNTIGFFETEVTEYQFIIVKDNQILLTTEKAKVFPQTAPFTLEFSVGSTFSNIFSPYQNISNLFYNLDFNETTNMFSYTFVDTSGNAHYSRLIVKKINLDSNPTTICDTTLNGASGIINCNATGYEGNVIAEAYISRSPERLVNILNIIISTAKEVFGISGLILGAIILGVVALVTSFSLSVMIISVNAVNIILNVIGLYSLSPVVTFAIMVVSIILLLLLKE